MKLVLDAALATQSDTRYKLNKVSWWEERKEQKCLVQYPRWNFAKPLDFVSKCQYFLISWKYLEGTNREVFFVCKLGCYCHPRWMGWRDGPGGCHRKMGC